MGQNPEQNPNYYEGYRGGYTPPAPSGSYGSTEEQPQSSYQHPEGQQGQQSPYGTEQQYYQQQDEQQQQQQQYYQQQQPQYNQYYQPPFSSTYSGGYGDASPTDMSSLGISARLTALLSYLFSWVGGLIVLLTEKQNQFVRFHAMQSILTAVAFWLLQWAASILPFVGGRLGWAIGVAGIIIWIVLMVKAYQGKYFKLPIIGDYAERFSRQIKI